MLPERQSEKAKKIGRVTVWLESSKKPVQFRNFSLSACCALSLASETQPHWRSLARLKGKPEPGTGPVIKKGRQKKMRIVVSFLRYLQTKNGNAIQHLSTSGVQNVGLWGGEEA